MSYKPWAIVGLLLISLSAAKQIANARGGEPGGAPAQERAPQQMQRAPQQEQRAPQQMQRAPQQEQRAQQMQRAPQQEQRAQQMQRAPQQEQRAQQMQRAQQQEQRAQQMQRAPQQEQRAQQMQRAPQQEQRAQRMSSPRQVQANGRASEKNGGNANRAREVTQRDQKAAKANSSANARASASAAGSKQTRGSLPRASAFANPRKVSQVRPGSKPRTTSARPQKLAYRKGAENIPHAGRVGAARAGVFDPGGYIRTGGAARIDRSRMQQQLASIPNYHTNFSNNNNHRISDHTRWPSHWNPGSAGANLGYYPGYSWNGTNYPFNYYAPSGYCPTPYLFLSDCGSFWQPGMGYADSLPYGYNQPISIGVDEVVPAYDAYGRIIGYQNETFYYNAFWDPNAQAYGYYDYRGGFHWVTFPWLQTWE